MLKSVINPVGAPFDLVQDLTGYATEDYVNEAIQEVVFTPDSITLTTGTYVSGDVDSVKTLSDGDIYVVNEVAGVPGFDISFVFAGIDRSFSRLWLHYQYHSGGVAHTVQVRLYNYTTATFDVITTFTQSDEGDFKFIDIPVNSANYLDSGSAIVNLYHITSGNASHVIDVDYVALARAGMGSSNDHGALVGLGDDDHHLYPPMTVSATEPTSPRVGEIWVDTNETAVDTTDHAGLSNLDYANAGHTGFQPAGNYLTEVGAIVGAPSAKTIGTVYQADTDGIVFAYGYSTSTASVIGLLTDNANPPTTYYTSGYAPTNFTCSTSGVVRQGDYYKMNAVQGATVGKAMFFFPLGT